ncbi:hypothetical protein LNKW23_15500 [Paralimibaculum aggregatum]|uniref:Cell division protein FtsL n=1 Tax=Paralimibaculum aggregatum TaxID=3036245 RepID=A0ABQ6LG98_9RHOB|nr:cell division protein FtsL [Limibaculum sp. NKW23]GMG82337.1 hypothetical protein LNKW23_15500 [Limibaculum sp. NKW23]
MTRTGFALSMLALVSAAAWAYHVNYETAEALKRVDALEREIAAERERIRVLDVEWALLNDPARLRRLVVANRDALMLMPITSEHFKEVAEIPYPPKPPLTARVLPAGEVQLAGGLPGGAE